MGAEVDDAKGVAVARAEDGGAKFFGGGSHTHRSTTLSMAPSNWCRCTQYWQRALYPCQEERA